MRTYFQVLSTAGAAHADSNVFQKIARLGLLAISAIVGVFVLLLTASAALVVVLALLFIGILVFAWLWTRAKFFGKTIGGKAFEDMKAAANAQKAQMEAMGLRTSASDFDAGDVVDAHKTPDGWTVD